MDDGSTDGGAAKLAGGAAHPRPARTRIGKVSGRACERRSPSTTNPLFFYTALDYPYTPSDIRPMLDRINLRDEILGKQPDLISGCRTGHADAGTREVVRPGRGGCSGGSSRACRSANRRRGTAGRRIWYRVRRSWVYGVPLADVNSCFKLFRTSFLKRFPIQSDGDFVHTELVAKATFLTSIMDEVPLTPKPDPIPPLGDTGADSSRVFGDPQFAFRIRARETRRSRTRWRARQLSPDARTRIRAAPMTPGRPRILFVTGKLAEPALRRVLGRTRAAGRVRCRRRRPQHHRRRADDDRLGRPPLSPRRSRPTALILPGLCRGDVEDVTQAGRRARSSAARRTCATCPSSSASEPARRRVTARTTSRSSPRSTTPRALPLDEILAEARRYRDSGADVIDLGCDPGATWAGVGDAVRLLRDEGLRVSIDSFNPAEVEAALAAGAELVLSVNGTNVDTPAAGTSVPGGRSRRDPRHADRPRQPRRAPSTRFATCGVPFRIDPILEPIGFGFAASLGRYLEVRRRYPDAEMMMGVGNLTELTDVDSAGVNVLLAGFCQELGIRSVLTTEVINWCRSAVSEFDLARRLVYHAVQRAGAAEAPRAGPGAAPRPEAVRAGRRGAGANWPRAVTDRNYRLFAERGEIHVLNGSMYLHGDRPVRAVRAKCRGATRSSTPRTPSTSATRWPRR